MNKHIEEIEERTDLDDYLIPRLSTIPNAGLGLFYEPVNANPIPEGSTICFYSGIIHNFRSCMAVKDRRYLFLVAGDQLVDPGPLPHIKARYINDPLNKKYTNCKYVAQPLCFRSAVVATRDILPGEEIFVSYGDRYWANQEFQGREKT